MVLGNFALIAGLHPKYVNEWYHIVYADAYQWVEDSDNSSIIISTLGENDPNRSSARIGFIHPWALRPKLKSREDQFDLYDYGKDQEEWTADDNLFYYGATASESWFTRSDP